MSTRTYLVYYTLLFFAHWFGVQRFDVDGDGDFDPEDVEAYFIDKSHAMRNFRRSAQAASRKDAKTSSMRQVAASSQTSVASRARGNFDNICSKTDGEAEEDIMVTNLFEKQRLPWFIIIESFLVFGLWVVFAILRSQETGKDPLLLQAGLDSISVGTTDLRISDTNCRDYRTEIWRWWTYQFTHIGAMHALMNVFLNFVLGVPLEGIHGHLRMFLMYNFGVFGGACCYFATDAHATVVGCSGGCYALIGIHVADLIMNWSQKKFRVPMLFFIIVLAVGDALSHFLSLSAERASHSVHLGGVSAGLVIGCLIGKNLKVLRCEKVLMAILGVVGGTLITFCLTWLFVQQGGPRSIWEAMAGESGWCWVRQIFSTKVNPLRYECIRCGTQACIDEWSALGNISRVSLKACQAQGFYQGGR